MIQFRPILLALGLMVCLVAVAMLIPMAVDFADGHSSGRVFAVSALVTLFVVPVVYTLMARARHVAEPEPQPEHAMQPGED